MRSNQSGILLVSVAIAIAVAGLLTTFWGVNQMRQLRVERAERVGHSLNMIGNATDTFIARYHKDINEMLLRPGSTFTLSGHTFTYTPASSSFDYAYVGNLDATSLTTALDMSGVATKPPHGLGSYEIRVYRECDRTNPPNCRINSVTYLTEPAKLAYSSSPDHDFAIIVAKTIGVRGGRSTIDRPEKFRFVDEYQRPTPDTIPNPLRKPGLVAMRGSFQTDSRDTDVARDGSRNTAADLDMQRDDTNRSIKGVEIIKGIVGVGKPEMSEPEIRRKAPPQATLQPSAEADWHHQGITGKGERWQADEERP